MSAELHIQIRPGTIVEPDELLANFPFEDGQAIIGVAGDVIIINLHDADDTSYVQEWYLNSHDDVFSFYIVEG